MRDRNPTQRARDITPTGPNRDDVSLIVVACKKAWTNASETLPRFLVGDNRILSATLDMLDVTSLGGMSITLGEPRQRTACGKVLLLLQGNAQPEITNRPGGFAIVNKDDRDVGLQAAAEQASKETAAQIQRKCIAKQSCT